MIIALTLIGGLGLPFLVDEHTIEVINLFILLFNLPTHSKFLLRDSIELLQLESRLI